MRAERIARVTAKAAVLPLGMATRRRAGDVTILLYHRVGEGDREIDLPLQRFEPQLVELARRHRIMTLDQAIDDPDGGGVVVTFDDGFRDFATHVVPRLVRHRIPATLFLATGLVANGASSDPQAIRWGELRDAVATGLVTVGSHTHNHTDLSSAPEPLAMEEMRRSKELIEERLGVACRHFAYPWSVGSPGAERVARSLFDSAAVAWGTNRRGRTDAYRLGRVPVLRSDTSIFFTAKARGWLDGEALVYRALRRGPWRPR